MSKRLRHSTTTFWRTCRPITNLSSKSVRSQWRTSTPRMQAWWATVYPVITLTWYASVNASPTRSATAANPHRPSLSASKTRRTQRSKVVRVPPKRKSTRPASNRVQSWHISVNRNITTNSSIKEAVACDSRPPLSSTNNNSNRRPAARIGRRRRPMRPPIFKRSSPTSRLPSKSSWFNSTRVVGHSNRRESVADHSFRRWRKHRSNKWLASYCPLSLAINTGAATIKAQKWLICTSYSINRNRMPVA